MIGLTGGIASGKSTVSAMLKQLGAMVIDADKIAKDIMMPGEEAYVETVKEFGEAILDPEGHIDRTKLGALIFEDPAARFKLNNITHPRVIKRFAEIMEGIKGQNVVVVWDVPLLFETGMDKLVNEVWVVWTDELTQVKRLMERNGLSEEEAWQRVKSQMPLAEKIMKADRLIDNRGSVSQTQRIVEGFYHQITRIMSKKHL